MPGAGYLFPEGYRTERESTKERHTRFGVWRSFVLILYLYRILSFGYAVKNYALFKTDFPIKHTAAMPTSIR